MHDGFAITARQFDVDLAVPRRKFDGVIDEVRDGLEQEIPITSNISQLLTSTSRSIFLFSAIVREDRKSHAGFHIEPLRKPRTAACFRFRPDVTAP